LTRCDAIDASPFRIRVNAVCPGIIDTPMVKHQRDVMDSDAPVQVAPGKPPSADVAHFIAMAPMNRMGLAEEIADVTVFLSGEKASFVQGAAWVVDGGYTIN
jgi:NAD(P)-dependent dehydrogenase (short-subunit alcohol dehydrogenase family)